MIARILYSLYEVLIESPAWSFVAMGCSSIGIALYVKTGLILVSLLIAAIGVVPLLVRLAGLSGSAPSGGDDLYDTMWNPRSWWHPNNAYYYYYHEQDDSHHDCQTEDDSWKS